MGTHKNYHDGEGDYPLMSTGISMDNYSQILMEMSAGTATFVSTPPHTSPPPPHIHLYTCIYIYI